MESHIQVVVIHNRDINMINKNHDIYSKQIVFILCILFNGFMYMKIERYMDECFY